MSIPLAAFRLGDVRGVYPRDLDHDFAVQFAHAFAEQFSLQGHVAVGRDMRESSIILQEGLHQGLVASGLNVVDLGLCTTELGYFASAEADIAAVIIVTASHNPVEYNGFKCVLHGGVGIHFENGLKQVKALMQQGHRNQVSVRGHVSSRDYHRQYIEFLKRRFSIRPGFGAIALNGLNGTASTLAADIATEFELPTSWFRKEPGPIPRDGADPVNPRLRQQMSNFMQDKSFSLGVAWDGDCDRCVFFDGSGRYITAYYMVGLLADHILSQTGPAPIVFDTKVYWNLREVMQRHGATPIPSKTGHAFMKEHMKLSGAVYGGELSSHHYFRDFFACDSGMYAWLKVVELVSMVEVPIHELVERRRAMFKCTPELSLQLADADQAMTYILERFAPKAVNVETDDGYGFDMGGWRFSIKHSKTEPMVRLNLETNGSAESLLDQATQLLTILEPYRAEDSDWRAKLGIE